MLHDSTLLCCYHTVLANSCPLQEKVACDNPRDIKARELFGHKIPHFPSENDAVCSWIIALPLYVKLTSRMWEIFIWFQVNIIKVLVWKTPLLGSLSLFCPWVKFLLDLKVKNCHMWFQTEYKREKKGFWNAARVWKAHVFLIHMWLTSLNWKKWKQPC